MDRQRLLQEIRRIANDEKPEVIESESFLYHTKNRYLLENYIKNRLSGEKWHQLVRFALSDPSERIYMYDRLWRLVLKHKKFFDRYFMIKSENGTHHIPDRQTILNRLLTLCQEYFQIQKTIAVNLHFDFPHNINSSNYVIHKVHWEKTLVSSFNSLPIKFIITSKEKLFSTPENMLLILSAFWMYVESNKILRMYFDEPLTNLEKSILENIRIISSKIVVSFPFYEVTNIVRKLINLPNDDPTILLLELECEARIKKGLIKNLAYSNLLVWIKKFRELNVRLLTKKSTNFPLETLQNLDTIYEAWIFLEFRDFFYENKMLKKNERLNFNSFLITFEGKQIQFNYEKKFIRDNSVAWAVTSTPDFTVEYNDKVIAVFDAKNYKKSNDGKGEATHKMLGYMTNLDINYGGLFFPNFPSKEFIYSSINQKPRFHFDLKLSHYQLLPNGSSEVVKNKKEILCKISSEIFSRIKN